MNSSFSIAGRPVGTGAPCLLIAEVGLAHEGSLGYARSFVDAAAAAGVDAVKFQTHIASAESTPREQFRLPVFPQDKTRYDYWKRTEFSLDQWQKLADYVRSKNLIFLSSPFSELAVDWLQACQVPAWKIASGEVTNTPLLKRIAATGQPALLSSGMSPWHDLESATAVLRSAGVPFGVFQCTTAYPCPPDSWGLNLLAEIRSRFGCPVGLSDHSGTLTPNLAAVTLGANFLEFHVTFHRGMFGPDVSSSLTFEQTAELVRGVRQLEQALSHPVDKDAFSDQAQQLRTMFGKSVVAATALPKGTSLQPMHLAFKKPGDGIPASQVELVLGKRLNRDLAADEMILESDLI